VPPVPPSSLTPDDAGLVADVQTEADDRTARELPPAIVEAARQVAAHLDAEFDRAKGGPTRAWARLAELVDRWPHRLSGSAALEGAITWSMEKLAEDGLDNARREPVKVPHWVRGRESARMVAPYPYELHMLGLGNSVGTKGRPLRGDVVVVDTVDEVASLGEAARGKIVLINQRMPQYDDEKHESGYGTTVSARSRGAVEAAKVGAKAVLVRSVTARSLRSPHTGALRYEDGVAKIPAAAISVEDAELLSRIAARGEPLAVELSMEAKMLPDATSHNVLAELPGRELRDEVVVIGGHIDGWDVGQGANDDASGCIMAIEAARMLKELGLTPRRTIRVVLFTNEENGLRGGEAYHAAYGKAVHAAAIEADSGSGAPLGFSVEGPEAEVAALARYVPLFMPLGVTNVWAGFGGADIQPLTQDGVLSLAVRPDGSWYFDVHHSEADTADKIDPAHLQRNAAALALMAFILAER
jgi:hypothetical protein